jgi:hypothetical protein
MAAPGARGGLSLTALRAYWPAPLLPFLLFLLV